MGTSTPPQDGQQAGTTVITTDQAESKTKLSIGMLPDEVKQALILRRQQNLVTAEIAATNWGKGLDKETRFQITEWSRSVGIDPATELDVLGGKFYKNAQHYLRKLSEMVERDIIEFAYVDHVEIDPRLETMAARTDNPTLALQARTEIDRRTMMRIQYGIPDAAVSSSVFHVKMRKIAVEFTAAKWCGGGTRVNDPVGDKFPVETCETRSIRRTLRLIASQNPQFKLLVEPNDDDQIDAQIGEQLRAGMLRAKTEAAAALEASRVKPMMALTPGDGYGAQEVAPAPVAVIERAAAMAAPVNDLPTAPPPGSTIGGRPFAEHNTIAPAAPVAPAPAPATTDVEQNDLDLMSTAERAEYEARKRDGRA